jgi:hypothetical protein
VKSAKEDVQWPYMKVMAASFEKAAELMMDKAVDQKANETSDGAAGSSSSRKRKCL